MFITIAEIIDIIIMTFAIGYIFSTFIKRQPEEGYDPLKFYEKNPFWEDLKFGSMIAAPAVVLHELAHKFTAMAFGATATLHAPIGWYLVIILLRMLNFPLIFFVGGYVSHTPLLPLQSSIVAVAGPLINLILFLLCISLVKFKLINRKYYRMITISGKLNLFLFIFNMLPIPGFDGAHFFSSLLTSLGIL